MSTPGNWVGQRRGRRRKESRDKRDEGEEIRRWDRKWKGREDRKLWERRCKRGKEKRSDFVGGREWRRESKILWERGGEMIRTEKRRPIRKEGDREKKIQERHDRRVRKEETKSQKRSRTIRRWGQNRKGRKEFERKEGAKVEKNRNGHFSLVSNIYTTFS